MMSKMRSRTERFLGAHEKLSATALKWHCPGNCYK